MINLPSTLPGRKGGPPHRAIFHQPLEALRASAGPDFRDADQGLSHFRDTVDASLRLMIPDAGIEPAPLENQSNALTDELIRWIPFWKTCASGRSVALTTECYTPLALPAAAGRTVFATWAGVSCHAASPHHWTATRLSAAGPRTMMTPLRSHLSMFGMETPRVATPTTASALAVHGGASPIFQDRSGGL